MKRSHLHHCKAIVALCLTWAAAAFPQNALAQEDVTCPLAKPFPEVENFNKDVAKVTGPALNSNPHYDIWQNNCHHFANRFMNSHQGTQTQVGVFACDLMAQQTAWAGHTVNWIYDGRRICLHEPQESMSLDPSSDNCMSAPGGYGGADFVNQVLNGTQGPSRARGIVHKVCQGLEGAPGESRAIPPGQMALESNVQRCAVAESKDFSGCMSCCADRLAMWGETAEGNAQKFSSGCSESCREGYGPDRQSFLAKNSIPQGQGVSSGGVQGTPQLAFSAGSGSGGMSSSSVSSTELMFQPDHWKQTVEMNRLSLRILMDTLGLGSHI